MVRLIVNNLADRSPGLRAAIAHFKARAVDFVKRPPRARAGLLALLAVSFFVHTLKARAADCPRREDIGDLIVLRVCGDYREMGRQEVALLEQEPPQRYSLMRQYAYQRMAYYRGLAHASLGARLFDKLGFPILVPLESIGDDSGYFHESHGIGDALGVSRANALRFQLGGLAGGSTVFVATGSATADGGAIIGRDVDWDDHYGLLRPAVVIYSPKGGAQSFISVCWPLAGGPAVGMNSSGLALSFNWFDGPDDPLTLLFPGWTVRLVLEKAHTVAEAETLFTRARRPGIAGFFSLADAAGNIGLVECTASTCAVDQNLGTWFSQTNNALTPQMIAHQTYRPERNSIRKAAMDNAVRPYLGRISPQIAAYILRNRANSPYIGDLTVANAGTFISAVAQPNTRTLWVSTTRQPLAPFGEYVPFSPDGPARAVALPADPRLGTPVLNHYAAVVEKLRQAVRSFDQRRLSDAARTLNEVRGDPLVDPTQLAWARARIKWAEGDGAKAAGLLRPLDRDDVLFDLRIRTILARGIIADQQGRRLHAVALYRYGLQVMDAHPAFCADDIRQEFMRGLRKPIRRSPEIDDEPIIDVPT